MSTYAQLMFHDEARAKLLAGATALADAVRPTLGPEAHSVLLESKYGSPTVCDDGVTIAKRVDLKDPEENLGARLLRDAAVRTGEAVGDGTTTSTLLGHAMVFEGMRNVVAGTSAMGMRRGMSRALEIALESMRELARPVKDRSDMVHVATVSAHDDTEIGELVADAVETVGGEGVVEVEDGRGTETVLEVVEGVQFDKGFLSPYFVTDVDSMRVELEQPLILFFDKKISAMGPLLKLLEQVMQQHRPLAVVAEDVDGEALATLVVNKIRGVLSAVAVKAPGFGERRKAMLGDFAVLTGARVISADVGDLLENVTIDNLGQCAKLVVDKDKTTIIDGAGDDQLIEARRQEIRGQIETTTSDWDREKLEERLARLSEGVAIIRVGALTEVDMKRRKEAFDDAIASTRAAISEGIVPGGGAAMLRAADAIEAKIDDAHGPERVGMEVVASALEVPTRQLARNSGLDDGVVIERIRAGEDFYGFDARTMEYANLDEAGVIDAAKVVRIALENAVAVASTLLLTDATLTDIEDPSDAPPMAMRPDFG